MAAVLGRSVLVIAGLGLALSLFAVLFALGGLMLFSPVVPFAVLAVLGVLAIALAIALAGSGRQTGPRAWRPSVRVRLPLCAECARRGAPRPSRIDVENYAMAFIVHREFERMAGRAGRG